MIQVYTCEEIDAMMVPAPKPSWCVPCSYQLFGPIPGNGLVLSPFGTQAWGWVTALTANTKKLNFQKYSSVDEARWVVVWIPNNIATEVRLVAFDYAENSGNTLHGEVELAKIVSQGDRGPKGPSVDVTEQMRSLVEAKVPKHIGYQLKSATEITLYEVRLEVEWRM